MHLFERHQLLIPLLVGLDMQQDRDLITEKEVGLLGKGLGELAAQLDLAVTGAENKSNLVAKPHWMTDKVEVMHCRAWSYTL